MAQNSSPLVANGKLCHVTLDRVSDIMKMNFKDLTHDWEAVRSMIFPYLFRAQSSASQVSRTDEGFFSQIEPPEHLTSPEYRECLTNHLLWERKESPWISTTSSLLRALIFARYRCLQAEDDVRITLIESRSLQSDTIFPASYLVEKYELKARGKLWHDKPDGEYLVIGKIPSNTFLGEVTYKAIAKQIEAILPELADKPHNLIEELRKYYNGMQNELFRALKPKDQSLGVQALKREYEAVRSLSNAFGGDQISLPLTLMCLAFRRRTNLEQEWLKIDDDFTDPQISECCRISVPDKASPSSMPELKEWKKLVDMVKRKWGTRSRL